MADYKHLFYFPNNCLDDLKKNPGTEQISKIT